MILLFSIIICGNAAAAQWRYDSVERIVAIADIHGDLSAMTETLRSASLLDQHLQWSGGASHLVIVGDMLDRGPDSREVMELLMRIEPQAVKAGGQIHVLIGNHESMLLTGDMRYVSSAEYAAFANEEDAEERAMWRTLFMQRIGGNQKIAAATFEENYPPGYFAMRRAFRADGRYGSWLLTKNIIEVLNRTAFVHGGLSPAIAEIGLHAVNQDLRQELHEYVNALAELTDAQVLLPTDSHYDYAQLLSEYRAPADAAPDLLLALEVAKKAQGSFLLGSDGPLWYRSNVLCQELVEEHRLKRVLQAIDADRVVVGHTPTTRRIVQQRFGGLMYEIDTGMLGFYYGGLGNALILEGDAISTVSQTGRIVTDIPEHPRRVGHRPAHFTSSKLESVLATGEIIKVETHSGGQRGSVSRTIATLVDGEDRIHAVFSKQKKRGVLPGVAAYRLDQLIGLDMVPVTVARSVNGKAGSLQFLPERHVDEVLRSKSGEGGGASCDIADQWAAMYVFDSLILNEARSSQRTLYDPVSWQLMLSEHDRAFTTKRGRPAHLRTVELPITSGWQQALTDLSDDVLASEFVGVLDAKRIRALALRRDQLLVDAVEQD